MKRWIYFIISLILIGCNQNQKGITVTFPEVSEPIQLIDNGKEHLFASYYGINSFSKSQKYATILETDLKEGIPTIDYPADLLLVDIETGEYNKLATTYAWNFQQGCMAHWLATSPDSLIIYNDLRNGKFVSVILNVQTKDEKKIIPFPISAVSTNGNDAVSINFARLHHTRADYGYDGNGQDARLDTPFPEDDGMFLVDLESGKAELIVSIAQVKELVPEPQEDALEYFNHTLFSRKGSKIFWLSRAMPGWQTTSLTVNRDGTNIQRCFPDDWGGSHFDWLSDDELMVTTKYNAKQYGHVLFAIGKNNYKRLGNGLLDYDGHGTFSPDGKWMITDSYPSSGMREQKIYLMHMETEAIFPIGRFIEPEQFQKGWRCDIHCRWSTKGDIVGFNSTHTGSRQAYIMKLMY